MPDQWEEVAIIHRGDNFDLERLDETGTFSAITLSEANLLSFLPLIQRECAQLLKSRSTPGLKAQGVEPIAAIPVRGFPVVSDLHGSELFLTLEDELGNSYRFSFSTEGARTVGQRLTDGANELAAAGPPPTRQ
jgi:hypothetical protein